MVYTSMIRLMTWNRKTFRCFPYGSSIYPVIMTILIVETPSVILTYDIFYRQFYPSALASLLIALQIFSLYSLFRCVYTDPGIIPQIVDKYEWDQQHSLIPAINHMNLSEHKYVIVTNGLNVYQKYCIQCCIHRPLRTIHCQICNHCVERYDHHCPWLGICIGKFNYQYFFMFITALLLLSATLAILSLTIIFTVLSSYPIHSYLLEIIIAAASSLFFLPILKLFTYHLELLYHRETTNQNLKGLYQILNSPVPFKRCEIYPRPSLAPVNAQLFLSSTKVRRFSGMPEKSNEQNMDKGKRYSTLVTDRQSVLNYLVESEL